MDPLTYKFDNGLSLIFLPSPTHVVYCGYTIGVGTRDENPDERGMAHFIEHLSFKGTEKRKSWHILNRMELVGGDLNAFTTKEETVYYTSCLDRDFERAVELLTDIVFHSTFPQQEIDKEVDVILDEIESYEDSPSDLIFDEFEELIYKGDALGNKILGDPKQLKSFKTADAIRFAERYYNPENATFFVYGNYKWEKVVAIVDKYASKKVSRSNSKLVHKPLPLYLPSKVEIEKDTHQAHVLMGTRGLGAQDPDRLGLYLINNIIGGPGMNSRLNVSLREHSGLVYNVESDVVSYTDTGFFGIYFGCDPKNIDRCCNLCIKELKKLSEMPLKENSLKAAKKQLIGQLGVSTDSFESVALGLGKSFLHYGKYETRERLNEKIEALQADKLQEIANRIFNIDNLTTLIYK
jgi:predicted Zn-dependent peptidase